jgi:transposase
VKIDLANLPDDTALLRQMFLDLLQAFQAREQDLGKANEEIQKLRHQLAQLRRGVFGRSSEKIDPAQLRLAFEELQQQMSGSVPPPPAAPEPQEGRWRGTGRHQEEGPRPQAAAGRPSA